MYCKADGVARRTVMQDGCRELQHVGGRGVLQGGQGVLQGGQGVLQGGQGVLQGGQGVLQGMDGKG